MTQSSSPSVRQGASEKASSACGLFRPFRLLLEMVRFSHVVFALPFVLVSLLVATQGSIAILLLVKIILAVISARNAAMTFNRICDARIDGLNERTRNRHLPSGQITRTGAWIFFTVNSILFLFICLTFNTLTAWLSLPTLVVLCFYSFCKRFTAYSHWVLGFGLGLGPMGAWIAARGEWSWQPVPLAIVLWFWVAGFDILYATQDEIFDRQHGLHSAVVRWGKDRALWIARFFHFLIIPALIGFWYLNQNVLGIFYGAAVLVISLLLFYEHSLVKPGGNLDHVQRAFFQVNGLISLLILVATFLDIQ